METLVSLGSQPPSNRFTNAGTADLERHSLTVAQCPACGLIQLIDPMPSEVARSRSRAKAYTEPEGHLDELVTRILHTVKRGGRAFGLTTNDNSTLARLENAGGMSTVELAVSDDFDIGDECAGLETIQSVIDGKLAAQIVSKHGPADVVVARYLLEHAHDPDRFLAGLSKMLSADGVLVLEVPDCRKFIDACDYSFIWEEHITYLSENTLTNLLRRIGLDAFEVLVYPQPYEDALVVIARASRAPLTGEPHPAPGEIEAGRRFGASLEAMRERHRAFLEATRNEGKRVALFGAGHLAVMFVNALGLGALIDAVIDDDPAKQGLAMPGSGVPIVPSSQIGEFDLVLLALSAESEKRVAAKFGAQVPELASIFRRSPIALSFA